MGLLRSILTPHKRPMSGKNAWHMNAVGELDYHAALGIVLEVTGWKTIGHARPEVAAGEVLWQGVRTSQHTGGKPGFPV